MILFGIVDYQQ